MIGVSDPIWSPRANNAAEEEGEEEDNGQKNTSFNMDLIYVKIRINHTDMHMG